MFSSKARKENFVSRTGRTVNKILPQRNEARKYFGS